MYLGIESQTIEFIPCISQKLDLRAEINVLLLSASMPGGFVRAGDIDNRLKTLLDALSMPHGQQFIPEDDTEPDNRLFCLLEDDSLVTRLDIANDRLLSVAERSTDVLAILDVHPVASRVTLANTSVCV